MSDRLEIVSRSAVPTDLRSQGVLLSAIERLVESVSKDTPPSAVGFGLPSQIDQRHGRVLDSTNVPLEDLDFKAEMASRLGVPVEIDNDANVACLAEWRIGAARGARNVVMLTLGTGVGGGLVLDGRLYRGSIGSGAELGHMSIDENGPRCQGHCNSRGCLEVLASATGVMAAAQRIASDHPHGGLAAARAAGEDLDARYMIDRAHAGDEEANRGVRDRRPTPRHRHHEPGQHLQPGGGGDRRRGGGGRGGAAGSGPQEYERRVLKATAGARIVAAELGNDAGVLGAAALVL